LTVKGDFLLQEIMLINDSLKEEERKADILQTFKNLIADARKHPAIEIATGEERLSAINDSSQFEDFFEDSEDRKGRLSIILKANLKKHDASTGTPDDVLEKFIESVKLAGRTEISPMDDSDISIVNPRQYRNLLVQKIGKDINNITTSMGADYRVILKGLDNEMNWYRDGDDTVAFYIPYEFVVIPKNISALNNED
jgi:hypothetical protein